MPEFIRFERCENCWWRSGPHMANGGSQFHECRLNAPVVRTGSQFIDFTGAFPRIELTDFCGEFEHRIIPKDTP